VTDALIYLRISQDRTGEAAGVARQREDAERRCRERGWTVVAVESDNDTSAAGKKKRPGFEAMLGHIESGRSQVVVAWSLDRLQRNRRDEVRLYELCKATGVTISLVNGADLDFSTAGGRLVADQLSSVARYEIELKADRQRRAQEQAAKEGRRVGGRRPFGYGSDGMTVVDDEAAAIASGYRAILGGEALAEVARQWNGRGLTTGQCGRVGERKGKPSPFTRSSVRDVLLNPRNAGLRAHNGEIVGKAAWPSIIDEGTFVAVRDLLSDPSRRTAPRNARALLTGVALCGICGATVHSGGAAVTQHVRVYRCRTMGHFSRSALPVEDYVAGLVVERLSRTDAAALLLDHSRPDVGKLREDAQSLRARLDAVALDFADGVITSSQLRVITQRLRERLAAVEAAMADTARVDVLGPLVMAENARSSWDEMPTSRQRAVIDLLMTITLHPPGRGTRTFRPETVDIEWKTS
jgi:site-specific DNA recombinase